MGEEVTYHHRQISQNAAASPASQKRDNVGLNFMNLGDILLCTQTREGHHRAIQHIIDVLIVKAGGHMSIVANATSAIGKVLRDSVANEGVLIALVNACSVGDARWYRDPQG